MGVRAGILFESTSKTPELIHGTSIVTHILLSNQNFLDLNLVILIGSESVA
jgi:hypothetical protein